MWRLGPCSDVTTRHLRSSRDPFGQAGEDRYIDIALIQHEGFYFEFVKSSSNMLQSLKPQGSAVIIGAGTQGRRLAYMV
jgi:hypothetical protein